MLRIVYEDNMKIYGCKILKKPFPNLMSIKNKFEI